MTTPTIETPWKRMDEVLGTEVNDDDIIIHEQPLVQTNEMKYVLDLDPIQVSSEYS